MAATTIKGLENWWEEIGKLDKQFPGLKIKHR